MDLAPYDFFLYTKVKSVLKGTHFPSVEEVKEKTAQLLNGLVVDEIYQCFEQWRTRMQRCVDKEAEYIEGDELNCKIL